MRGVIYAARYYNTYTAFKETVLSFNAIAHNIPNIRTSDTLKHIR